MVSEISDGAGLLEIDSLLTEARSRTGLDDFGSDWFLKPLRPLTKALTSEDKLSDAGVIGYREHIVRSLVNRLRMFECIRQHPEILDEHLDVACVIIGLPRTGSTLFQRMLSAMPGFTSTLWWELQNFAPFPNEKRGQPTERIAEAREIMDAWLAATPDLASIHPMAVDQSDEEAVLLDHVFTGVPPEMFAWIPTYFEFLSTWDQREAYADLALMLKFLQWQSPGRKGKKWVLKAPTHLTAPEAVFETFPNALIVTTHREPRDVIPSVCSMTLTLYKQFSYKPDPIDIGRYFPKRWADAFQQFDDVKSQKDPVRFVDVNYLEVLKEPMKQVLRVCERMGLEVTPQAEAAVMEWLNENKRDDRPSHKYEAEEFGLTAAGLDEMFAVYRSKYLGA